MLVLMRRVGETIMVGDDIEVKIMGVSGYQVKVGINAPHDTPVHREEIYLKIKGEEEEIE